MAIFADLSTELLLNIAAHLTTGDASDVRALLLLCRTSRTLLKVAQPALYTCVTTADPTLRIFLRTLIERPDLAKKTREIALINNIHVIIEPEPSYNSLAAQVLARLPNLQHLHFTAQTVHPRSLLLRMHELQADDASFLSALKTFHLHKQYEDGPVDIEDLISFMRYPSFERLSTESDAPGEPRAINALTHSAAKLLYCPIPLSAMQRLLAACPHLSEFQFLVPYAARYRSQFDTGRQPLVTPRDLLKALLQEETHRQNLETLHLDFHHHYDLGDPDFRQDMADFNESLDEHCFYVYPSFRGFERLTQMMIEFEKLVKPNLLPASLKSLKLELCHFGDLDQEYLLNLTRLKERWCPIIESVDISGLEEETNNDITTVREHTILLDLSVHVSGNGRVLEFLDLGFQLQIRSLEVSIL